MDSYKKKKSYLTVWYVILPFFHVGSIAKKFRFRFIFMWVVIYNSKDAINEANKNLKRILIDMGIKSYSCILNVECYCYIYIVSYKLEPIVFEYQISKTRWLMFLPESLGHINAFKQEPSSDASWHLRHSQLKYQTFLNLSLLFLDPVNNDWYWMVNSSPFLMSFCARISIPTRMN